MEIKELTREEAIRRHRLMWNWMADEIEKLEILRPRETSLPILAGTTVKFMHHAGAASMPAICGEKMKRMKKNLSVIFVL